MNEQEFIELSAGYALNALSADDRHAFEAARDQHPEWAAHLGADIDTAALLADATAVATPPAAVRAALLARIAETPQTDAASQDFAIDEDFAAAGPAPTAATIPVQPKRRVRQRWFALAASVALVAVVGFGGVLVAQQLNRPAAVVALEQIEDAPDARSATVALADGGEATAHWSAQTGQAVLVSEDLPVLASDETFEMWFVRGDGAVSAGTFDATDGGATALLTGDMQTGDAIAVTVEAAGGSTSGAPTSTPIIVIPTA